MPSLLKKIIASSFLVILLVGCSSEPKIEVAPVVGAVAPDFQLQDINGQAVSLSAYRGQPVLVNFWATWCPPCLLEMPTIQARYEMHHPELVVLAVDYGESVEEVTAYANSVGLTFDPLLDSRGEVTQLFQVRGNPTSYFIDQEGIIQVIHIGMMSEEQIDTYLAKIGLQ